VDHYFKEARSQEDLSDVTVIEIDEISYTKVHKYVTFEMDFDTFNVIHARKWKYLRMSADCRSFLKMC
jgi:hypothetical protein